MWIMKNLRKIIKITFHFLQYFYLGMFFRKKYEKYNKSCWREYIKTMHLFFIYSIEFVSLFLKKKFLYVKFCSDFILKFCSKLSIHISFFRLYRIVASIEFKLVEIFVNISKICSVGDEVFLKVSKEIETFLEELKKNIKYIYVFLVELTKESFIESYDVFLREIKFLNTEINTLNTEIIIYKEKILSVFKNSLVVFFCNMKLFLSNLLAISIKEISEWKIFQQKALEAYVTLLEFFMKKIPIKTALLSVAFVTIIALIGYWSFEFLMQNYIIETDLNGSKVEQIESNFEFKKYRSTFFKKSFFILLGLYYSCMFIHIFFGIGNFFYDYIYKNLYKVSKKSYFMFLTFFVIFLIIILVKYAILWY